jgi:hypothetical protein
MITIDTVKSVYSGKDGKCCCGCAGKHSEDQKQKTRIINIINKAAPEAVERDDNGVYAATVIGNRVYIAYFND